MTRSLLHPTHPSQKELEGFALGTLAEPSADTIAEHVHECSTCEATLHGLESASDELIAGLRAPVGSDLHEQEAGCQRMVAAVQTIGRETASCLGGDEASNHPLFEAEFVGDYRLLAELGRGGMGTVYRAVHTRLDKVVALKILPAERMRHTGALARFQREMKAIGALAHANIVTAHDAGEADHVHYLVMELVEGPDCSKLVRRLGPLPGADACEIARQAAIGLQFIHEHGMVHRDIKPSNIMVSGSTVKILDLGLARLGSAWRSTGG